MVTPHHDDLAALLERGQGLPGRFFTEAAIFDLEKQRVFDDTWMCIGLSSDVPASGDLVPVSVFDRPLLLVRDGTVLRVFHNVCSHRGAMLVGSKARGRPRIVCPYHSWAYKLGGELVSTPHVGGFGRHSCESLDPKRLGLRSLPCAEWAGHVFVNFSGTAPEFSQWIRPAAQRFASVTAADWVNDTELARRLEVQANWKLIVENFVESYHLPWVHKGLNSVNPMEEHYQILGGHRYLGQGATGYEGAKIAEAKLPLVSGLSDYSRYETLFLFPNLILGPLPDMAFSIVILPEAVERTRERVEFFFVGQEALSAELAAARRTGAIFVCEVNTEDIQIVESAQRGRHSPAFVGGQFAPAQETTSLQLQKIVAARLMAADDQRPEDIVQLPTGDIAHAAAAG